MHRYVPLLGLLLVLVLAAAAISFVATFMGGGDKTPTPSTEYGSSFIPTWFSVEDVVNERCTVEPFPCDIRLLGRDGATGETRVLVENLSEVFRQQTGFDSIAIEPFYFPESAANAWHKLIFKTATASSNCCQLYSYDLHTTKFAPLTHGRFSALYGDAASPDSRLVLRMNESGTELTVSDVMTDRIIATISASPGESFIDYRGGYGGDPLGKYAWHGYDFFYAVYPANAEIKTDEPRSPMDIRLHRIEVVADPPQELIDSAHEEPEQIPE